MKLWIDKTKPAPKNWVWVTKAEDCIKILENIWVEELSIDHDLVPARTIHPVLAWLKEQAAMGQWNCIPCEIYLHTSLVSRTTFEITSSEDALRFINRLRSTSSEEEIGPITSDYL